MELTRDASSVGRKFLFCLSWQALLLVRVVAFEKNGSLAEGNGEYRGLGFKSF